MHMTNKRKLNWTVRYVYVQENAWDSRTSVTTQRTWCLNSRWSSPVCHTWLWFVGSGWCPGWFRTLSLVCFHFHTQQHSFSLRRCKLTTILHEINPLRMQIVTPVYLTHLKMLHSGSSLVTVGSSTYSNWRSLWMWALSTYTDTLTSSMPWVDAWERHVIHWPPRLHDRRRYFSRHRRRLYKNYIIMISNVKCKQSDFTRVKFLSSFLAQIICKCSFFKKIIYKQKP